MGCRERAVGVGPPGAPAVGQARPGEDAGGGCGAERALLQGPSSAEPSPRWALLLSAARGWGRGPALPDEQCALARVRQKQDRAGRLSEAPEAARAGTHLRGAAGAAARPAVAGGEDGGAQRSARGSGPSDPQREHAPAGPHAAGQAHTGPRGAPGATEGCARRRKWRRRSRILPGDTLASPPDRGRRPCRERNGLCLDAWKG